MAGKRGPQNVNDHLSHQSDIFANLVGGGVRFATFGGGGGLDLQLTLNKNDSPMSRIELPIITILTPKPTITAANDVNLMDTKG